MRIRQRLALIVACGLGLALVPAAAAQAATPGRHCVVSVSPGAAMTCYASFTTAISAATGGRVTDAPNDAKAALTDEKLATKLNKLGGPASAERTTAANNIVISIEYASSGFSGSSLIVNASHTCDDFTNPVEFTMNSMPSGWNDEIESFRAYANCAAQHFLHIGTSQHPGLSDGAFFFNRSSFESWLSDEISSISWT
jgi:hypothetical protein